MDNMGNVVLGYHAGHRFTVGYVEPGKGNARQLFIREQLAGPHRFGGQVRSHDPGALGEGLLPVLPSLISRHTVVVAAVHDPALDALAAARDSVESLHTAAAAERGLAELTRMKAALTRYGVHVVDAPAQSFASEVADTYLNLKAAGRL